VESAELIAILHEVRDRVRARNPQTSAEAGIALPDLLPLMHARDAAVGKVASIGTVNPRRGGPVNWLVQAWKHLAARALDWHVREQVEFNRKTIEALDAAIEALNATNRALADVASRINGATQTAADLSTEFNDIRHHWSNWRVEWEKKLAANEIQFLRSVADLQAGFQHRVDLMDANHRDLVRAQHDDFLTALDHSNVEIQKRLWGDMERVRMEYERLIHTELRLIRQRGAGLVPAGELAGKPSDLPAATIDYARFAERFRGSEEYVKRGQQFYVPYFAGRGSVLDVGCGRGEFLEAMREAGIPARGIDLSPESVALCRQKGLDAVTADLFSYLADVPQASLDGIFCAQVVEHIDPARLPDMVRLAASRLERNGVMAIETPNPECLAIFATHFYLDPTHMRPVPHPLLIYYMEEAGLGDLHLHRLSPALESMPALASLAEDFRQAFFGGLDYAVIGKKL